MITIPACLHMSLSESFQRNKMCGSSSPERIHRLHIPSYVSSLTTTKYQSKMYLPFNRMSRMPTIASASTDNTATLDHVVPQQQQQAANILHASAAKQRLLDAISGTQRGSEAWPIKRGSIEEAQVAVESTSPLAANWSLLEGTWDVIYTTASDVLPLVKPAAGFAGFPFAIGRVGQRFSNPEQGVVQNLIEVKLFDGGLKATLVVEASYEIRTARSIALSFRSAGIDGVVAGDSVQNLLAPALLPRGWLNMEALMALERLSLQVPLSTRVPGVSSSSRQPVGINYNITYLDEEMLIGRAQGNGGTFIFMRRSQLGNS